MNKNLLNGLVLAGGKSSRMGYDKSLIEYHAVSQREHVFQMLKDLCDEVYTSCKRNEDIPDHLNPLQDKFELDSPLNGILTAFSLDPNIAWLTVPIDMPLVDRAVLNHVIDQRDQSKIATCFFDSEGKNPEPLLTLWEKKAYTKMIDFYKAGNKSPREFLIQEGANVINIPDKKYLININDQEELKKFRSGQL